MSIDIETARKVHRLSRIKAEEGTLSQTAEELNKIISFVEQLSEVNTDNVKPLPSPVAIDLPKRIDEVSDGGYQKEILTNAPETQEGYFVVAKIVE